MTANGDRSPWLLPAEAELNTEARCGNWLRASVKPPEAAIEREVSTQGLLLRPEVAGDAAVLDLAQHQLEMAPSIAGVVRAWVREIHLLASRPGYDVSHSEPRWPHRIFVSMPERRDAVGALRVSENVVHEAMHLQLTGLEMHEPLVRDHGRCLFSPWRDEPRAAGGVLHGLFVFTGLSAFFSEIAPVLGRDEQRHALHRISEIRSEIATIDLNELLTSLTPSGASLVNECHSWVLEGRYFA